MSSITLRKVLGSRINSSVKGDVGIEIEVEYTDSPNHNYGSLFWSTKDDGSLRYYGREHITNGPIFIKDVPSALGEISKYINSYPHIKQSCRTSVHVHVNILDKSFNQMMNLLVASWLLENAMIKYCNADLREGNLYCLRIKDAEYIIDVVDTVLSNILKYSKTTLNYETVLYFRDYPVKYSAINVNNIPNLGTIEYRALQGLYDEKYMSDWVHALHNLSMNSESFSNPQDVVDYYLKIGPELFVNRMLGAYSHVITHSHPQWKELIEEQEELVLPFVFSKNWKRFDFTKKGISTKRPIKYEELLAQMEAGNGLQPRIFALDMENANDN